MKKYLQLFLIAFFSFNLTNLFSQETQLSPDSEYASPQQTYTFSIFDGILDSFTMRQMNQNYFSISRIVNRGVEEILGNKNIWGIKLSDIVNFSLPAITMAFTHEEGHRSILTANGIGSISQPFFNLHGTAYVKGVTDQALINFRDSDKASFVRMYTAGIESDFMMNRHSEQYAAFGLDDYSRIYPDYFFRTISLYSYQGISSIFYCAEKGMSFYEWLTKTFYSLEEESNEYLRDIAGYDPFGAARALFNPSADFKRYVSYSDLTDEEKDFLNDRVSNKALLNLLSPFFFGFPYFNIGEHISFNASVGYFMVPFGDLIEENVYFQYKGLPCGNLNFNLYARQAQNYKNWYPAFGVRLVEFSPCEWLSVSSGVHLWWQPENLEFFTDKSIFGGAFELSAKFILPQRLFPSKQISFLKSAGVELGILWKSQGFMPEIEQHKSHFRFNIGLCLSF